MAICQGQKIIRRHATLIYTLVQSLQKQVLQIEFERSYDAAGRIEE
jgi:hypothetical protein